MFEDLGYLMAARSAESHRKCGAQQALIAKRVDGHWHDAAQALGLVALFVIGAACGSLIVLGRGANRQPWVLLVEALLLAAAAIADGFGFPGIAIAGIVLAMALENAVFQIDGGAGLGLTYVTGALVKAGQLIAAALTGGARWG
jgi:uncharacterized membrane protein YoaK (UPF0700 family)